MEKQNKTTDSPLDVISTHEPKLTNAFPFQIPAP